MLTNEQKRKNLRRTFKELCRQVWQLRFDNQLSMEDLALQSRIPPQWIDALEFNRSGLNIGYLSQLAAFYNKRIKIELVDGGDDAGNEAGKTCAPMSNAGFDGIGFGKLPLSDAVYEGKATGNVS